MGMAWGSHGGCMGIAWGSHGDGMGWHGDRMGLHGDRMGMHGVQEGGMGITLRAWVWGMGHGAWGMAWHGMGHGAWLGMAWGARGCLGACL
jgi:hypothetical protein